jgi:hypothetical protein
VQRSHDMHRPNYPASPATTRMTSVWFPLAPARASSIDTRRRRIPSVTPKYSPSNPSDSVTSPKRNWIRSKRDRPTEFKAASHRNDGAAGSIALNATEPITSIKGGADRRSRRARRQPVAGSACEAKYEEAYDLGNSPFVGFGDSLRDLYTITTELLVRLVDEPTKLLGALFAVIATVFVFRESRQQPVRGTGSPHRDVRQLRCMPSLSFDFSRHGFGHGGRYRFGRDRDDTFEPRGPHLHYGDHDRSCLGRRTIELARSVAARMLARAADGAELARAAPAGSLVAIFRLSPFLVPRRRFKTAAPWRRHAQRHSYNSFLAIPNPFETAAKASPEPTARDPFSFFVTDAERSSRGDARNRVDANARLDFVIARERANAEGFRERRRL